MPKKPPMFIFFPTVVEFDTVSIVTAFNPPPNIVLLVRNNKSAPAIWFSITGHLPFINETIMYKSTDSVWLLLLVHLTNE